MSASDMSNPSRIPVEARDSIRSRGSAVVLLKEIAGVTQEGNLKTRVVIQPRNMDVKA